MLDLIILVPVLLLPIATITGTITAPRISERACRWLPAVLLSLEIAAILSTLVSPSKRIEISKWALASFSLVFQLDGISLVLLLVLFFSLIALELERSAPFDSFSFAVLSSSVLLICSGNLTTAVFSWAFLDFALFAWRESHGISHEVAIRALILGQLSALILFAGSILIDAKQTETGATLVALAFWARLGLYPFHWIFPIGDLQPLRITIVRGSSLVAGASLWLHWDALGVHIPTNVIVWLGGIALVAALVWSVREVDIGEIIGVNASNAAIAVPFAMAFGGELASSGQSAALALALWTVLGIVFAVAMFELGINWPSDYQSRWGRLCFIGGIICLAGIPLTPAFFSRVGIYVMMAEGGHWVLLLVSGLALTLALAPLWKIGVSLRGNEQRDPTRIEYTGMQVIGVLFIAVGFAPLIIPQAAGQSAIDSANQAINVVIRTNDVLGVAVGFTLLFAAVVMSFLAARVHWGYRRQLDELARFAARVMDLEWLARLIASVGQEMSRTAVNLSALAEENPTVWILLVGLWIAIYILTSR